MTKEQMKVKGIIPLDNDDIIYQLGSDISVAKVLPEGALPLKSKPVGKYIAEGGQWVEAK